MSRPVYRKTIDIAGKSALKLVNKPSFRDLSSEIANIYIYGFVNSENFSYKRLNGNRPFFAARLHMNASKIIEFIRTYIFAILKDQAQT